MSMAGNRFGGLSKKVFRATVGVLLLGFAACAHKIDDVDVESPAELIAETPAAMVDEIAPQEISLVDLRAKYETATSQYIDVDGVEIHYIDEGDGPVVVLLHASWINNRSWDGVAARLVDAGYRVVRPDFPNAGLSGVDTIGSGNGKIDFTERNTDVIAKFLDLMGLEGFDLVATSSGGSAGFRYAAYYPDRVRRLILINSAGMPRTRFTDPNRARPELEKWENMPVKPREYWRYGFARNFAAPNTPPDWLLTMAYDMNRRAEKMDWRRYFFETGDPKSILANITAPTLILWGIENPTVMHLEADVIEHWMTGALTLTKKYQGLGHYPYIEDEELVVSDILDFLSGMVDADMRRTQRIAVSEN